MPIVSVGGEGSPIAIWRSIPSGLYNSSYKGLARSARMSATSETR